MALSSTCFRRACLIPRSSPPHYTDPQEALSQVKRQPQHLNSGLCDSPNFSLDLAILTDSLVGTSKLLGEASSLDPVRFHSSKALHTVFYKHLLSRALVII